MSQKARSRRFRVPGSPVGSHPHTPWHHCVFWDPYERINFWSHAVPGLCFLLLGLSSYCGFLGTSTWEHNPLGIFCLCATLTHWCSAITHVYPDSHSLEKLDHVGIVALIIGTPLTAILARTRGHIPPDIWWVLAWLLCAAILPPKLRVGGFVLGPAFWICFHTEILTRSLCAQTALYLFGALSFLRNGGHSRAVGLQDHHFLHYTVSIACCLQVWSLWTVAAASTRTK